MSLLLDITGPLHGPGSRSPETLLLWQVKLAVLKSLKPMLNLLLPNDDLREQVYDYIPLLLAEYQSPLEAIFITQVWAKQVAVWAEGSVPTCPGARHLGGSWDVRYSDI